MVFRTLTLWMLLSTSWSFANEKLQQASPVKGESDQIVNVGVVDGDATEEISIVNIRLSAKPPWRSLNIEDHGGFIQVTLPNTVVLDPGKFIEIKSPFFEKIVLYQAKPTLAIARIFTKEDAAKIRKFTDAEVLDARVVITLDHKGLRADLSQKSPLIESNTKVVDNAPIEVKAQPPAENEQIKAVATEIIEVQSEEDPLQKKIKLAAWISAFLIVLLLTALTSGRMIRNRKILESQQPAIQMKALSHLNLAPKQRLSLVQVGNEKILLSVCPDQISLITHIKDDVAIDASLIRKTGPQLLEGAQVRQKPAMAEEPIRRPIERHQTPKEKPKEVASQIKRPVDMQRPKAQAHASGKKISYAVGDEGIVSKLDKDSGNQSAERAIEDVTKLIRDKLKTLPRI